MNRTVCQLVQRSEAGWVASLGDGASSGAGGRGPGGARFSSTAGGNGKPEQVTWGLDEFGYASPGVAEDASCKVIFDGALYNRAEVANRLASSSNRAAWSDADLILHAYLRWGQDLVHHVRGIFALLIWDKRQDALLCMRDPLGVYPLFYAVTGRALLFSTSIEALVQHPDVSDSVNRAALADYLCYRTQSPSETFYEAVNRIPPGHVMKVSGSSRREYRYWDPVPDKDNVDWVAEDELERFDELLDQAVNRCLQFGRTGIFLSGGLDSVSVAAVAADNSRRKGLPDPWALSIVFPDPECNEEDVQRRVAASLGLPHELVPFDEAAGPQGLIASAIEMSSEWPAPLYSPWAPAYSYLRQEGRSRGCRVIITGGGGDEWLGVTPYYAADLLRALDLKGLYRLWSGMERSYRLSRLALMRNILWRFGARPWVGVVGRNILRRTAPGLLRAHWRRRITQLTPDWIAPDPGLRREIDRRMEHNLSSKPEPRSVYFDEMRPSLDHPFISMEMEENFESGRRAGTRMLMPYWDADLVDFLYRTPPELLNKGERTKAVVRETVARRFPRLEFERQKKTLGTNFFTSVVLEEGARLWEKMDGAPALAELGIVDAPALNSAVSDILSGSESLGKTHRVRDILFVEAWLRPRLGLPMPDLVEGRSHSYT